jgi:hypothetical protein
VRFHLGPIPEDPVFDPSAPPWRAIREPGPGRMQMVALPVAFGAASLVYLMVGAATPLRFLDVDPLVWVAGAVAFVLLHELCHAVLHPGFGLGPATVLGFWPSRLLFYAHYDAEIPRNRFIAVLAGPLVLLTAAPAAFSILLRPEPLFAALAIVNAAGASGDIVGMILLASQIPADAIVRNKGWRSYWRPRDVAETSITEG